MSDLPHDTRRNGPAAAPTPTPARRIGGLRQVIVTLLARLRFVAILAVIGVVIIKWDLLKAYYERWTRPVDAVAAAADPDTEYFCPMHPSIVRDNNKEKCPICFMPLSRRKKGEATDAPLPPGVVSRVQLTPYRVVLAGVRTVPVEYVTLTRTITTVGAVEFDERGLKHVAARVKGRIDKLSVNQTGQMVHKGDELATLYSPDLVVTVQNLLDARRSGNAELEKIARERLVLWGIEADQVEAIARGGKAVTHVPVRSPIDGHVIKRYQTEGRYVDEGSPLYDVADLATVWIQAQLYEEDLGFLPADGHELPADARPPVVATTRAFPGESFAGTLSFVYPHVDQESRTLTARFALKNPDHRLRPGMTATVRLDLPPDQLARRGGAASRFNRHEGKVLAVPEASIIDTGSLKLVYRRARPGEFEGVRVELGPRMAGPGGAPYFPLLSGLEPGEEVVAAGSFLIDAETRLNPAAGSIYIGGSGGGQKTSSTARPSTPDDPDAKAAAALARLPAPDRELAQAQGTCVVLHGSRLGSMGAPVKLTLQGKTVFVCCPGCESKAAADPAGSVARADELKRGKPPASAKPSPQEEAEIRAELAKLSPEDRALAEQQRYCPATDQRLGSMGVPVKLTVNGKPVFVCCEGCDGKIAADPAKILNKVEAFKKGQAPRK